MKKKTCSKCGQLLDSCMFGTRKESKSGLRSSCKLCVKRDRKDYYKKYYAENSDKISERVRVFRTTERGKSLHRASLSKYKKRNRGVENAYIAKRRANKRNATPGWLSKYDFEQIKNIYNVARKLTIETLIPHEVDHVVPLVSSRVCGLHVPWNLQILTATANQLKSNKLDDLQ